ncbi:hypothetical protein MPHL43070_21105 [Mycolicibacterium phlei DSM 43070]|nr:hypothetical protein MPHL43070_21105 [Mycolicibacterium phlei DSM 43070]KXW69076.1 hypothetical protein MPHL43239_00960 [Mycolicibacterium phlei DSM 43239 = CCUG 21000]
MSTPEQVEQGGQQVDTAEQLVVDLRGQVPVAGRAHDHRDTGARVVERRLRAGQRRAVVGQEHHPGGAVQAGLGERVEQPADGGVGDGDRAVEVGEVLAHLRGVGQVVGHLDRRGVGGFVTVVGPVGLEEPGGEQERSVRRVGEPAGGPLHDVLAVGVGDVELVEAQLGRVGGLVLHAEQRGVPARVRQQMGQGPDTGAVLPAVVGQTDQAVALRVAAGEQRTA